MEETEKIKHKLPNQEIDYFKIAQILLSRWYWMAGSLLACMIFSNLYLWYTPKVYATYSTMKFEEKKSELPDLAGLSPANERNSTSKIQSETIVLQSTPLLLNAIKQLDYRISFFVVGRVLSRTSELYPAKPLNVQLIKFDSLNFFHDLITFNPVNKKSFNIIYKGAGKDISQTCYYNVPFTIGPTSFSISYPGELPKTASFLFKLNTPEDFVGRVRGGFHTSEAAKNSNIISLQETDLNPQFAADILNAIMKEYLNYDRNQRTQSATQMIQFIDSQLDFLSKEVKGSENSISEYKQNKKILDVGAASETATGQAKELGSQIALLKIQEIALDQVKQEIIRGKDNVNLNFNLNGLDDPELAVPISTLNGLIEEKNTLLKTYNLNSAPIQDINQQILQIKSNALNSINSENKSIELIFLVS